MSEYILYIYIYIYIYIQVYSIPLKYYKICLQVE